ncbi:MAG TPA: CBS domain-containing protein [Terriglobales bacterium]|nr:CBS domain-containing protein [Terriglobales bacterium]
MATIRELLRDREVFAVQFNNTVQEVATFMADRNIGAVPVLRDSALVGVFSERDVVRRVLLENRDWSTTHVSDVMSEEPLTVVPDDDVEHCMLLMKQHNFRHLPVCENGNLTGFISMRELLLHDLDAKEIEVRMMRAYMNAGAE